MSEVQTDYLVLGSGVAGLYFALRAAEHGRVLICTKRAAQDTSTDRAQGGIAVVQSADDSFERHIEDTLKVGDGLCNRKTVELTVREGPAHIEALADLGAQFDRDADGRLQLGREGGHSERRVVHHKDITGREVQRALLAAVAQRGDRIQILENHIAIDLLSLDWRPCLGRR